MRIVPFGGCGEFGLNLTVYARAEEALLVDCGAQMPDDLSPGVMCYVPDLSGLLARFRPRALVLTHGHDDHIGAVPHLLRRLGRSLPIYGRALTLRLLRTLLDEERVPRALLDLRVLDEGDGARIEAGPLSACVLHAEHSIPDACSLLISGEDEAGRVRSVLHTGDLKLDGAASPLSHLPSGVDVMVGDSTNATREGRSGAEGEALAALAEVLAGSTGRVAVALFSSHIERIAGFAARCAHAGRRLCLVGRGLREATSAAIESGALFLPQSGLVSEDEASSLDPARLAILCTGSQGEEHSGLARLARGGSMRAGRRALRLEAGDVVVLAARTIPGGELRLGRLCDDLLCRGVRVVSGPRYAISGHAARDELRELIAWVRPRLLVPVHGGVRQLLAHAELGRALGVPALIAHDGDVIDVAEEIRVVERLPAGRLAKEGRTLGEVGPSTLRQRRRLSRTGVVVVAGSAREVLVRCYGVRDEGAELDALCEEAGRRARAALAREAPCDRAQAEEAARRAVRSLFHEARGVRPVVLALLSSWPDPP